tara:strand:- start:87 stop:584 length:498 start_codon:yes stop_codon:yes gene_type:complete
VAIILEQQNINDNNPNKKIGIDFPFKRATDGSGDGYFQSTYYTIDAVKVDLANLLNTTSGERLFQPDLGVNLSNILFEQQNEELSAYIEEDISKAVKFWMPFITLVNINIISGDESVGENPNQVLVDVEFILNTSPKNLESVQIDLGDISTTSTPMINPGNMIGE